MTTFVKTNRIQDMEKAYTINKPVYSFFYLCILFFTVGLNITDFSPGWVQQNPPIGNRFVTDIKFLDSLSGWAVTDQGSAPDSAFILKTSDGGNNWIIQYRLQVGIFHALSMVNISTGYACGISSIGLVMKTTNGGLNWTDLNFPGIQEFIDIDFINKDTGWVCDQTPLGGLWRTTNGGFSWDVEATVEVNNVFFVNDTTGWFT